MLQIKIIILNKAIDLAEELYHNGYIVYTLNQTQFLKYGTETETEIKNEISCIIDSGYSPEECLLVDDNTTRIGMAKMTGCKICLLRSDCEEPPMSCILKTIMYYQNENCGVVKRTMFKKRVNIVIPMMGIGLRLHNNIEKGYTDIMGKPMISWVIQNLQIDATYIFIVKFDSDIDKLLVSLVPGCKIIKCDHKTEGQIGSILLAEQYINNSDPLIVANDNQWLDWDIEKMLTAFLFDKVDSLLEIITFTSDGNHRYNYVELDDNNNVILIKQNRPITQVAITDIYFWRRGEDFIRCAHRMTSFNKRIRGEFCTMLVVNELLDEIRDNVSIGKITTSHCKHFAKFEDCNDLLQFQNYWISHVNGGFIN